LLETYEENPCTNIEQDEYLTFDKKCDTYEDELSEYSDFDSEYEDETLDAVDKGDDEISEDYKGQFSTGIACQVLEATKRSAPFQVCRQSSRGYVVKTSCIGN